MSSHGQSVPFLTSLVLIDGALGLALAYAAVCALQQSKSLFASLRKIQNVPTFRVADLRIVIDIEKSDEPLLVLRGTVDAKPAVDGESWKSLSPHALFSQWSRAESFIIPKAQTSIWKLLSGWTSSLPWNKQSTSPMTIPFILFEGDQWPLSDCIIANLDVSRHPLPLTPVFDQLLPATASPYTFLQVGLLDKEKSLPSGMEIGALGIPSFGNGAPEIKTYMQLPYLLTDVTKDQIMSSFAFRTKILFWGGIFLGLISIGTLGYSVARKWSKWRLQREQRRYRPGHVATEPRRYQQPRHVATEPRSIAGNDATTRIMEGDEMEATSRIAEEEEMGRRLFGLPRNDASSQIVGNKPIDDVPDKTLCLICYTNEREVLFIPCRHLVCCQKCVMSIESIVPRRCPYCRRAIQGSCRVYMP